MSDAQARYIIIAPDIAAGKAEAHRRGIKPTAIVTPRSLNAGRGVTVDYVMEAPGLTIEQWERLLPLVMPSLAVRRGHLLGSGSPDLGLHR